MKTANLRLRPHHIYCLRFLTVEFPDRSPEFQEIEARIKRILMSDSEMIIEAIEGVDELCQACANCVDNRCVSPNGDETVVRKWDGIILKEIKLSFGDVLTANQWRTLIANNSPLAVCRRCR